MSKKKILVVEDEKILNSAYETILTKSGHAVEVAYDGNDALEHLKSFKPDVILLDLKMPNLDGIGFLKAYNKLDEKSAARLCCSVILTSKKKLTKHLLSASTNTYSRPGLHPRICSKLSKT